MFAYVLARFDITDPEGAKTRFPRYQEESRPAAVSHKARFIVRGGAAQVMEGTGRARNVVIGFPTLADGRAWYNSEIYQAARQHRLAVAQGEMALVEGVSAEEPVEAAAGSPKPGYWIGRYDVSDMGPYKLYIEASAPAFERYGAKFLARGGAVEALEGQARGRNVLVAFPSVQHALDCFHSDMYQAARAHRLPASEGDVVIVEGA